MNFSSSGILFLWQISLLCSNGNPYFLHSLYVYLEFFCKEEIQTTSPSFICIISEQTIRLFSYLLLISMHFVCLLMILLIIQ